MQDSTLDSRRRACIQIGRAGGEKEVAKLANVIWQYNAISLVLHLVLHSLASRSQINKCMVCPLEFSPLQHRHVLCVGNYSQGNIL